MPAGVSNPGDICFLDNIRKNNGIDGLKNYIRDLFANNNEKAVELINDENLHYCSLYVLLPELKSITRRGRLRAELSERNRTALRITKDIESRDSEDIAVLTQSRDGDTLSALKWILGTGYTEDGLSDGYETVMEQTAILLSRTYRNTELLEQIEEMIFTRYRKGLFIHYLVWAFFEARSTYSLSLLANRLLSAESSDVELAKRLLSFIPPIAANNGADGMTLYMQALDWMQENQPFLYYTGESLHQTGAPHHYDISYEARYLCRPVSPEDGSYLRTADDNLRSRARSFNKLDKDSKKLLSSCSYLLYRRNIHQWNTWINLPVERQLKLAADMMGGSV